MRKHDKCLLKIDFYTDVLKRPPAEPQHTLHEKKKYMNMMNLPPERAENLRCIYWDSDFASRPVPGSLNDTCTWPPVKLGLVMFLVKLASKALKMAQSGIQCVLCAALGLGDVSNKQNNIVKYETQPLFPVYSKEQFRSMSRICQFLP